MDHQQIAFLMPNGFCLLSKTPTPYLSVQNENVQQDGGIPTKFK